MTPNPRHAAEPASLLGAIWAQTENGIIGANGTMPWHVPEDLAHFKRTTAGHPVIMGRTTWDSFPEKFRPLPGRENIVLTTRQDMHDELSAAGAIPVSNLDEALALAKTCTGSEEVWIIGGGKVYAQAMDLLDVAVITKLDLNIDGDTSAPALDSRFSIGTTDPESNASAPAWMQSSTGTRYRFETWIRTKD
ncbi:dihydrofolate reductase [Glutamicibacter sp.]|uniref:dihydrofolate reductase n=1 Tax=Glutamicibacter sp. TaxID=1931995 RepID=UPI0028BD52C9|nr:dihydrofolate reductase [Glutamicibacter sp.]